MRMDLLAKGVSAEIIEQALEEELEVSPETLIQKLLEKKHYCPDTASVKETAKIVQFLLRKGFRKSEIMQVIDF